MSCRHRRAKSLSGAVQRALEERLERLTRPPCDSDLVELLLAIGRRCSSLPDRDPRLADEILGYDEIGPPPSGRVIPEG